MIFACDDMSPGCCCGHLVQRRSFHQLKWGGVYTYLLHIDWFIQLFLFPGFDLNQPITREERLSQSTQSF